MANKHFTHAPTQAKAQILVGEHSVSCAVLEQSDGRARVRVLAAASIPEHLRISLNGEDRRARVALRKQCALGLDLWLDLHTTVISAAA